MKLHDKRLMHSMRNAESKNSKKCIHVRIVFRGIGRCAYS